MTIGPPIGSPDGHGRYAILDTDDDGRLLCHECGRYWQHLATHAWGAHGLRSAEYRQAHGLGASTRLVAAETRQRMREAFEPHRDAHLAALDASRQPSRATTASLGTYWAPETRAKRIATGRARRGRSLTETEATWLVGDGYDLQAWADRARVLLADGRVPVRALAEASDIAESTAHQRLRRFPPKA